MNFRIPLLTLAAVWWFLCACESLAARPSDASAPAPTQAQQSAALSVPGKLTVKAQRVLLGKPARVRADGTVLSVRTVVEFTLTAEGPIPARALDPVLQVGDRQVREYRYEAPNVLVFTEPLPEKLPARAAVSFHWGTQPEASNVRPTEFTYDAATLPTIRR